MICGDFNVPRFPFKMTNDNIITRAMDDFNQHINDLELLDPPFLKGVIHEREVKITVVPQE